MALTKCPECDGGVSDAAPACPHCGYRLQDARQTSVTPSASPAPTEPGWYNDPSGEATHQAYWDGKQWTGATRPNPSGPVSLPPKRGVPTWVWIVGALVLVAVVVSQLNSNDVPQTFAEIASELEGSDFSDSEDPPSPTATDRISVEGQGDGATRSFDLSGGSYDVTTQVGNDCFYSFTLKDPADGSRVESITTMSEPGSTTVSMHGIDPGTYYVDVITGPAPSCPWEQTWASS